MRQYFLEIDNQNALIDEIHEWVGTGFRFNTGGKATKGISADCVSFPLGVFKAIGLIPQEIQIPPYSSVKGGRGEYKKLLGVLESLKNLELFWERQGDDFFDTKALRIGDLIVCSSGSAIHHVLIYAGNDCAWHCWPSVGVCKTIIQSKQIKKFAKRIYRFLTNAAK